MKDNKEKFIEITDIRTIKARPSQEVEIERSEEKIKVSFGKGEDFRSYLVDEVYIMYEHYLLGGIDEGHIHNVGVLQFENNLKTLYLKVFLVDQEKKKDSTK